MNEQPRTWLKKNGPLIVIAGFAVLALLYLGDSVVNQRSQRISLTPIVPEIFSDDPYQGNKDATVTVIEFGEFSCSACAAEVSVVKDIINDYGEDVLFVWKDAPLDTLSSETRLASIAAQCAAKQNKFWEMQEALFLKQSELGRDLYLATAEDLKLDVELFTSCFDNRETNKIVNRNIQEANDAFINATPTFYINGIKYEGYMEYVDFIDAFSQ